MNGKKEITGGVVVTTFAVLYFIAASNIKINTMLATTRLDSASMPKLWGVLLGLLGLIMIVRGSVSLKRQTVGKDAVRQTFCGAAFWKKNYTVAGSLAALGFYVLAFDRLGFILSSAIYAFVMVLLLSRKEERKIWLAAVVAVAAAVLLDMVFRVGFKIPLPQGILSNFVIW